MVGFLSKNLIEKPSTLDYGEPSENLRNRSWLNKFKKRIIVPNSDLSIEENEFGDKTDATYNTKTIKKFLLMWIYNLDSSTLKMDLFGDLPSRPIFISIFSSINNNLADPTYVNYFWLIIPERRGLFKIRIIFIITIFLIVPLLHLKAVIRKTIWLQTGSFLHFALVFLLITYEEGSHNNKRNVRLLYSIFFDYEALQPGTWERLLYIYSITFLLLTFKDVALAYCT